MGGSREKWDRLIRVTSLAGTPSTVMTLRTVPRLSPDCPQTVNDARL